MEAVDYQFLKDTQEKAEKVIKSCLNKKQLKSASQYCFLLAELYEKQYKLDDFSRMGEEDYKSIKYILNYLKSCLNSHSKVIKKN